MSEQVSYEGRIIDRRIEVRQGGNLLCRPILWSAIPWFTGTLVAALCRRSKDLLDIATAVRGMDRLAPRSRLGEPRSSWSRKLNLHVPVRDPDFWNSPAIKEDLEFVLNFLTDDRWHFFFQNECSPSGSQSRQESLFGPDASVFLKKPVGVCLFSGGLDSLAGLAIDIDECRYGTIIPVAVGLSSALLHSQREMLRAISNLYPGKIKPFILAPRIGQTRRAYNRNERTQRTRGFFFGCIGATVAKLCRSRSLRVYENGVGAINLPLTAAHLGAQATRATHPVFLRMLSEFLQHVFDRDFQMDLPFIFSTKGEMCTRMSNSPAATLAGSTISCDGYPARRKVGKQCGVCTSCVLRRLSLGASSLSNVDDGNVYRFDVTAEAGAIPDDKIAPFEDMLRQASRLKRALRVASWSDFRSEFPDIMHVLDGIPGESEAVVRHKIMTLYASYCSEMDIFSSRARDAIQVA